ncbi:MAG TPA: hypothetical protein DEA96_01655 [Leptospiraceae bacterium]|nr:hypothetical protein [Spirochaetaceae bacterium]HBS03639.1 hypothetical protein [Leptospiraceae bacterium]
MNGFRYQNLSRARSSERARLSGIRRWLVTVLVLMCVWYAGGSCSLLQALFDPNGPQFRIAGFSIEDISLEGMTVKLDAELKNPYPVGLPASSLNLDLNINQNHLTKVNTDPIAVKANSVAHFPIRLNLEFKKVKALFQNLSTVEQYTMGLRGSADFDVKMASLPSKVSVPLSMEQKVPAFFPDVTIENFDFSGPDFISGADSALSAAFDLKIKNQAAADFLVQGLNYSLELSGNSFLSGESVETKKDGDASVVRVDSRIPLMGAGRAFLSLFQSGGSSYRVKGNSDLEFPGSDLASTAFGFDKEGKLAW